jgi:bifunctional non-homologous end joining protein LigD
MECIRGARHDFRVTNLPAFAESLTVMSLVKYRQKRSADKTPEPFGGEADTNQLRFVIQKHAASHLHYDFRLELRGVLKSWAVPKGPSLDPSIKRLAMMVEDHPYDYRTFEGIIPQRQYGGGTVIVWDEGTYESDVARGKDKKEQEKQLMKELQAGVLKFTMKGKKLRGSFALVKVHSRGENGWLLIKHDDKYASDKDIAKKDKSVISGKTLEQVAATSTHIYGQPASKAYRSNSRLKEERQLVKGRKSAVKAKGAKTAKKTTAKKPVKKKDESKPRGKKRAFPSGLRPMLATLVDKPFDKEGWQFEVKWDGYRALAFMNKGKVELKSRNDKSFNEKFYAVHRALTALGMNAVLDGEIVVTNEKGISDFGALQNWRSEADGELLFYAFDILWMEGYDLTGLPLSERRDILKEHLEVNDIIRISEIFDASGTEFFETAKQMGLEGIIAKKSDSLYDPGARSKEWLKIKSNKRQEMVIGGFTRNDNSSKLFSSLLVGVMDKGRLRYTGKIGTGFTEQMQRDMMKQFKPYIVKTSPFQHVPDINKPSRFRPDPPNATATWLKPELVCEVSFTEMTADGVMRHPSFEGMRTDKKAEDVKEEKAIHSEEAMKAHRSLQDKKLIRGKTGKSRKTLLNPTDETQVRTILGHELKFTNLSKVYWPKGKITKRDMLNYYYQVAPYMLPYLVNRPMSLNRHPDGITGPGFYQKDVTGKAPDWVDTFPYFSEADARQKNFLVCMDEAHLLYMASLGCIEMNPWSSTRDRPDHPDWCIIDLDPDKQHFDQVVEAAQAVREFLDELHIPCYPKTSGSTGLHIYIPLGAQYTYEQSKELARIIATAVHQRLPRFTSIERAVSKRKGKMYIDFLQNRSQATLASPYSLRPKPDATVSMPLEWDEVKKGLKMKDFTIHNALERIAGKGDIFKKVLGKGIDLEKVIARYRKLREEEL